MASQKIDMEPCKANVEFKVACNFFLVFLIFNMLLLLLYLIFFSSIAHGEEIPSSEIAVDLSSYKKINPFIYGHNTLGYDPCYQYGKAGCSNKGEYSNYGAGQWYPERQDVNRGLLEITKKIQIPSLRFPGGCGTHLYNWKKTIGPLKNRPLFQFGIDEFLRLCEQINAVPIITLSYFTGTDSDLSDLIEYLNYPVNAGNPHGGINWASVRKTNGHYEPYHVVFFEFGNEVWHGTHGNYAERGAPSPAEYAARFASCQKLFREVNPDIQLGAVLRELELRDGWNYDIVTLLKEKMDFGAIHIYPITYAENDGSIAPNELFSIALASPLQVQHGLKSLGRQLKDLTGKSVPLMITEYNGGFKQERPVPYRHCLGNALLNAELLKTFLTAETPIMGANYWQLVNSAWGALYNPFYMKNQGDYIKRPNFFIFELFRQHFEKNLVQTSVSCPAYLSGSLGKVFATRKIDEKISSSDVLKRYSITPDDWKTSYFRQIAAFRSAVAVNRTKDILTLSFPFKENINFYHIKKRIPINPDRKYLLTGKIKTEWPTLSSGIFLNILDERGWKKTLWAKSTQQITGATDWCDVQVEFQPLTDAKAIDIIIRRMDGGGPAHGKAWIRDVVLQDIGPATVFPPTPYLSAVASIDDAAKNLSLIVINKNLEKTMTARIRIKNFSFKDTGNSWVVNGTSVDSTNGDGKEHVKITDGIFEIKNNRDYFDFTFEPHSVTALEVAGTLYSRRRQ